MKRPSKVSSAEFAKRLEAKDRQREVDGLILANEILQLHRNDPQQILRVLVHKDIGYYGDRIVGGEKAIDLVKEIRKTVVNRPLEDVIMASTSHPVATWWKRLWLRMFHRDLDPKAIETVEIETK